MNDKYRIAYAYRDGLKKITESDAKILTHVNIAFGLIGTDGRLRTDCLNHMDAVAQIRRWNPDIKIILSIGGWGAGGFSEMARTGEGRKNFAGSCAEYVRSQELDGIDIDWEYLGIDWSGIVADPSDKVNYTLLLQELRNALGKEKLLSVAVGAGDYFIANSEMDRVADICDYVQLMTYDMRAEGCFEAGHHMEESAGCQNVSASARDFLRRDIRTESLPTPGLH